MLRQVEQQIRDAYQHAKDCARLAKVTRFRQGREDWLLLASRYLSLAQSLGDRQHPETVAEVAEAKKKSAGRS
jgi:hypothetical protein